MSIYVSSTIDVNSNYLKNHQQNEKNKLLYLLLVYYYIIIKHYFHCYRTCTFFLFFIFFCYDSIHLFDSILFYLDT